VTAPRLLVSPYLGPKWYCPGCGEVRYATLTGPPVVKPHLTGSSSVSVKDDLRRRCGGGPVDPEEDKAP